MSEAELIRKIVETERKLAAEGCLILLREIQKLCGLERSAVRSAIEDYSERMAGVGDANHTLQFLSTVKKKLNEELE